MYTHIWPLGRFFSEKKNIHFVEDHPMNIPTKFGATNWPIGLSEED